MKNGVFSDSPTCGTSHNLHLQTKHSNNRVTTIFLNCLTLYKGTTNLRNVGNYSLKGTVSLSPMSVSSKKPLWKPQFLHSANNFFVFNFHRFPSLSERRHEDVSTPSVKVNVTAPPACNLNRQIGQRNVRIHIKIILRQNWNTQPACSSVRPTESGNLKTSSNSASSIWNLNPLTTISGLI